MISLKSQREIEIIFRAAKILSLALEQGEKKVAAGTATQDINTAVENAIVRLGGVPAFKGYRGFPCASCISINEEVVHGIPGPRRLKEGDVVSIDVGVGVDGYYADAARTWTVGEADERKRFFIKTAQLAFLKGAEESCRPGKRIGDLSAAIQQFVESRGFQVVRDFVGHGIGRNLHEEPQVPNYGRPGHGPKMEVGLVLAIEPMVTEGHYAVEVLEDGWTVVTKDRRWACHYEDTIAITEDGYLNLTGGTQAG